MNKMMNPEMEIVRFEAEDIMTASCIHYAAYHVKHDDTGDHFYEYDGTTKEFKPVDYYVDGLQFHYPLPEWPNSYGEYFYAWDAGQNKWVWDSAWENHTN